MSKIFVVLIAFAAMAVLFVVKDRNKPDQPAAAAAPAASTPASAAGASVAAQLHAPMEAARSAAALVSAPRNIDTEAAPPAAGESK